MRLTQRGVSTGRHSISVGRVGGGGGLLHRRCSVGVVGRACMSFLLTCGVPSPEPPSWAGTENTGRNSDCQLEAGLLPPHSWRGLKRTDPEALFCVTLREGPGILGGSTYVSAESVSGLFWERGMGRTGALILSLAEALGSNHSSTAGSVPGPLHVLSCSLCLLGASDSKCWSLEPGKVPTCQSSAIFHSPCCPPALFSTGSLLLCPFALPRKCFYWTQLICQGWSPRGRDLGTPGIIEKHQG